MILRFPDLAHYGVNNWPTLGRWIREAGAPAGFYLGPNTRCWYKDDWDDWLANRPSAAPPDIVKPAASPGRENDRRLDKSGKHPLLSESPAESQALPSASMKEAAHA